ncbi:39S ribosomal protein L55, mitochondrial isoform X1 [Strigops habroptila]|uniref:Mitochondrial ribosomal protein L55 n=2 Tax=Strigops habroptila TaxID=2489341 RepID=A0A672TPL8_STRHB|nr:39S ribosomal protein L55, mitochondrial isoform X1 [Strigops habroptila]
MGELSVHQLAGLSLPLSQGRPWRDPHPSARRAQPCLTAPGLCPQGPTPPLTRRPRDGSAQPPPDHGDAAQRERRGPPRQPPPCALTSGGGGPRARPRELRVPQGVPGGSAPPALAATVLCAGSALTPWSKMAAATRALSALRLDTIPRLPPVLALSSRSNSNRTSISHLHRQLYGRLYPVLLVKADGSTVRLRYKEPKRILMLPLDSNTLPEAERKARLRRQFPSKPKAGPEDTFEGIDLGTYERFWKK